MSYMYKHHSLDHIKEIDDNLFFNATNKQFYHKCKMTRRLEDNEASFIQECLIDLAFSGDLTPDKVLCEHCRFKIAQKTINFMRLIVLL